MKKLILLLCCTSCCILYAHFPKERGCDLPMTSAGYFGGDMAGFDPEDRNAIRNRSFLWPKGIIPYVIDENINNFTSLITEAIEHYSNHTGIRFIPRSTQTDYIYLTNYTGCWSQVGRQGGKQEVSLGAGCERLGIVMHEMLHAVGFIHEQNRPDRDDYITVYYDNVEIGQELNFLKFPAELIDVLDSEYDYESIMHYGKYSFSKDRKTKTIESKPRGICIFDVAQKNKFSQRDLERIQKLYEC